MKVIKGERETRKAQKEQKALLKLANASAKAAKQKLSVAPSISTNIHHLSSPISAGNMAIRPGHSLGNLRPNSNGRAVPTSSINPFQARSTISNLVPLVNRHPVNVRLIPSSVIRLPMNRAPSEASSVNRHPLSVKLIPSSPTDFLIARKARYLALIKK